MMAHTRAATRYSGERSPWYRMRCQFCAPASAIVARMFCLPRRYGGMIGRRSPGTRVMSA